MYVISEDHSLEPKTRSDCGLIVICVFILTEIFRYPNTKMGCSFIPANSNTELIKTRPDVYIKQTGL